jgi:hypothetical protein
MGELDDRVVVEPPFPECCGWGQPHDTVLTGDLIGRVGHTGNPTVRI